MLQQAEKKNSVGIVKSHEVVGQVYQTKDYDVFRLRMDNRKVEDNLNLKEELKALGILTPIMVNEKYEIIDGQNRLENAKKLGISVPYIIKHGAGKREMISINTTSKKWELTDYIETYAKDGIEAYEQMKYLIKTYSVVPGALCSLAFDTTDTHRPLQKTRNGQLVFKNYDFLVEFLEFYQELIEKTVLVNTGGLVKSLYILNRLKKFDQDRVFDKSGAIANKLRGIQQQGPTMQTLLISYNQRLRDDNSVIQYRHNARQNVEFINEELKDEIR